MPGKQVPIISYSLSKSDCMRSGILNPPGALSSSNMMYFDSESRIQSVQDLKFFSASILSLNNKVKFMDQLDPINKVYYGLIYQMAMFTDIMYVYRRNPSERSLIGSTISILPQDLLPNVILVFHKKCFFKSEFTKQNIFPIITYCYTGYQTKDGTRKFSLFSSKRSSPTENQQQFEFVYDLVSDLQYGSAGLTKSSMIGKHSYYEYNSTSKVLILCSTSEFSNIEDYKSIKNEECKEYKNLDLELENEEYIDDVLNNNAPPFYVQLHIRSRNDITKSRNVYLNPQKQIPLPDFITNETKDLFFYQINQQQSDQVFGYSYLDISDRGKGIISYGAYYKPMYNLNIKAEDILEEEKDQWITTVLTFEETDSKQKVDLPVYTIFSDSFFPLKLESTDGSQLDFNILVDSGATDRNRFKPIKCEGDYLKNFKNDSTHVTITVDSFYELPIDAFSNHVQTDYEQLSNKEVQVEKVTQTISESKNNEKLKIKNYSKKSQLNMSSDEDKSYYSKNYRYAKDKFITLVCIQFKIRYLWISYISNGIITQARTNIEYLKIDCFDLYVPNNSKFFSFNQNQSQYFLKTFALQVPFLPSTQLNLPSEGDNGETASTEIIVFKIRKIDNFIDPKNSLIKSSELDDNSIIIDTHLEGEASLGFTGVVSFNYCYLSILPDENLLPDTQYNTKISVTDQKQKEATIDIKIKTMENYNIVARKLNNSYKLKIKSLSQLDKFQVNLTDLFNFTEGHSTLIEPLNNPIFESSLALSYGTKIGEYKVKITDEIENIPVLTNSVIYNPIRVFKTLVPEFKNTTIAQDDNSNIMVWDNGVFKVQKQIVVSSLGTTHQVINYKNSYCIIYYTVGQLNETTYQPQSQLITYNDIGKFIIYDPFSGEEYFTSLIAFSNLIDDDCSQNDKERQISLIATVNQQGDVKFYEFSCEVQQYKILKYRIEKVRYIKIIPYIHFFVVAYLDLNGKLHFAVYNYDDSDGEPVYKLQLCNEMTKLVDGIQGVKSLKFKRKARSNFIDMLLDLSDFGMLNLNIKLRFETPTVNLIMVDKQVYAKPVIFNDFNCDTTNNFIICGILTSSKPFNGLRLVWSKIGTAKYNSKYTIAQIPFSNMQSTASFAVDDYFQDNIAIITDGTDKDDKTLDIMQLNANILLQKYPNPITDTTENLKIENFQLDIPKTGFWNTKSDSKLINGKQWIELTETPKPSGGDDPNQKGFWNNPTLVYIIISIFVFLILLFCCLICLNMFNQNRNQKDNANVDEDNLLSVTTYIPENQNAEKVTRLNRDSSAYVYKSRNVTSLSTRHVKAISDMFLHNKRLDDATIAELETRALIIENEQLEDQSDVEMEDEVDLRYTQDFVAEIEQVNGEVIAGNNVNLLQNLAADNYFSLN